MVLDLIGLAVLMPLLVGWQQLTGVSGPDAFGKFPPRYLVPIVVLFAPVLEETVFRGWLSGRPRALWLLSCAVLAIASIALAGPASPRAIMALLTALIAAAAGWTLLRRRPASAWFARSFAPMFYASAAIFALVHTMNFAHPGLLSLPLVLPQLWSGLTLGYIRIRFGLPAAMATHAAANTAAITLALAGG